MEPLQNELNNNSFREVKINKEENEEFYTPQDIIYNADNYERGAFSQSPYKSPNSNSHDSYKIGELKTLEIHRLLIMPQGLACTRVISHLHSMPLYLSLQVSYKAPKVAKLVEFNGEEGGVLDTETWLFQAQQCFTLKNINPMLHTMWVAQHLTGTAAAWNRLPEITSMLSDKVQNRRQHIAGSSGHTLARSLICLRQH